MIFSKNARNVDALEGIRNNMVDDERKNETALERQVTGWLMIKTILMIMNIQMINIYRVSPNKLQNRILRATGIQATYTFLEITMLQTVFFGHVVLRLLREIKRPKVMSIEKLVPTAPILVMIFGPKIL